jgi:hypothetical protein
MNSDTFCVGDIVTPNSGGYAGELGFISDIKMNLIFITFFNGDKFNFYSSVVSKVK